MVVDTPHEDLLDTSRVTSPPAWLSVYQKAKDKRRRSLRLMAGLARAGWLEPLTRFTAPRSIAKPLRRSFAAAAADPARIGVALAELDGAGKTAQQVADADVDPGLPVRVLLADRAIGAMSLRELGSKSPLADSRQFAADLQRRWLAPCRNAALETVAGSGHRIPMDRPDAIVEAVRALVT